MTYPEFLVELSRTPRDWTITYEGIRRGVQGEQCPITALTQELSKNWLDVARRLGLRRETARQIRETADGYSRCNVVKRGKIGRRMMTYLGRKSLRGMRQELLEACGLSAYLESGGYNWFDYALKYGKPAKPETDEERRERQDEEDWAKMQRLRDEAYAKEMALWDKRIKELRSKQR